ncbi:MAG: glycogen/starch synthase [Muribaculaceae bacterium]|nr:glycogen/starch synthase [Muribaculaceae bacterium]
MENNKILYIAQEIAPYLPDNDLSSLSRNIPQSVQEKGFEVRTFMPKFGNINERRNQLHEVIRLSGMNIVIDDTDHQLIIKVATLLPSRMQIYFIDNEDYFQHHVVKDIEIRQTPEDNDERIMFYIRGVIETVKKLRWEPSIIHNVGWISALAPIYIKKIYNEDPSFRSSKVVFSLVNDAFEGTLDPRFVEKLKADGIEANLLTELEGAPVDYKSLIKFAIRNSDGVVCSMPNVDPELIEYAKASGVPFLEYPGDDAQAYINFYESL